MIQLPNTPFNPTTIQSGANTVSEPWINQIINKRVSLDTSSNYSSRISTLENYLNFIYGQALNQDGITNYQQVIEYSKKYIISCSIPWNLPITKHHQHQWTLEDEIIIVVINLSISYNSRSSELIGGLLSSNSEIESEKIWLSCFKMLKKALQFINFLKTIDNDNGIIFETSNSFINFISCLIQSSSQLNFLIKTIWSLKKLEYDITLNDSINYSTLSRISISIKDEIKQMINILKINNIEYNQWQSCLDGLIKYINGYIGVLLSIENYKQDKIGISIGFLEFSKENITRKSSNEEDEDDDEEDSKFKKKMSMFKKKIKSAEKLKKLKTKSKFKLNKQIQSCLSSTLEQNLIDLFELLKVLDLKYTIENDNLKFDEIPSIQSLLNNYLPSARSIPIESTSWIPNMIESTPTTNSTGYY